MSLHGLDAPHRVTFSNNLPLPTYILVCSATMCSGVSLPKETMRLLTEPGLKTPLYNSSVSCYHKLLSVFHVAGSVSRFSSTTEGSQLLRGRHRRRRRRPRMPRVQRVSNIVYSGRRLLNKEHLVSSCLHSH